MAQQKPPVGWVPTGNGGYKNPASGTVIYPNGRGGWTGVSSGGSAQSGLPADYGNSKIGGKNDPAPTIRDAGSGRGTMSTADKSKIFNMTPRARQLYLKSMGYNVKVDGKSGPQTASAAWAFVHGKSASFYNQQGRDWQNSIWNQHFAKYHTPTKDDPSPTVAQSGAGKVPGNDNNSTPADAGNAQFSGSALGTSIGNNLDYLDSLSHAGTLVNAKQALSLGTMQDPDAAGSAAAELAYGQSLRDQQRVLDNLPAQAKQHQADLTSWYGQVSDRQQQGADAAQKLADSLISSSSGVGAGLVSALGGGANPSAADLSTAVGNNTAGLQALKVAGALGASDMSAAIGAAGAGAKSTQAITDQNAITQAQQALDDLRAQYGATSTQAKQVAIGANNDLSQQRLSDYASLVGQNNSLINDRSQRAAAALSAGLSAAALGPSLALKQAQTASDYAKAGVTSLGKGAFDNTDAKTKGAVADAAVTAASTIISKGGTPEQAVQAVNNLYRSRGWSLKNPRVVKAVMASLRGAGVKVDPHWWAKFGYTGN